MDRRRRGFLLALSAAMIGVPSAGAGTLVATPRQSAGPFYPVQLPLDDDNDLTRVKGRAGRAKGVVSDLTGSIVDINGKPIPRARIEIWQCDANGRYRHPSEKRRQPRDEHFQGHGHSLTDEQGRYRFRTIRPVPYPGRTPHIHIAVMLEDQPVFVTQMYVAHEPTNSEDFLFRRVPVERRHLVLAEFQASQEPDAALKASFDIVLDRAEGTPLQS